MINSVLNMDRRMRRIRNVDEDRIASVLNDSESTLPVDQESSQDINTEDENRSANYEYHDNLNEVPFTTFRNRIDWRS